MIKEFLKLIKKHNNILIITHKNPDLDAIGSTLGLYELLKDNLKNKNIFYKINLSTNYEYIDLPKITEIKGEYLTILLDTSVRNMTEYTNLISNDLIIFDHHQNNTDFKPLLFIKDSSKSSTCELLVSYFINKKSKFKISKKAAEYFYYGLITDSNRFYYSNTSSNTFLVACKLLTTGIDIQNIYKNIYEEDLETKKIKNEFFSRYIIEDKLAYLINDETIINKYSNLSFYDISRGMVNLVSGIKQIHVWINITLDKSINKYVCELRSKDIEVLSIAKKYGGGGHLQACGMTLNSKDEINSVIMDLKELIKEKL